MPTAAILESARCAGVSELKVARPNLAPEPFPPRRDPTDATLRSMYRFTTYIIFVPPCETLVRGGVCSAWRNVRVQGVPRQKRN